MKLSLYLYVFTLTGKETVPVILHPLSIVNRNPTRLLSWSRPTPDAGPLSTRGRLVSPPSIHGRLVCPSERVTHNLGLDDGGEGRRVFLGRLGIKIHFNKLKIYNL